MIFLHIFRMVLGINLLVPVSIIGVCMPKVNVVYLRDKTELLLSSKLCLVESMRQYALSFCLDVVF